MKFNIISVQKQINPSVGKFMSKDIPKPNIQIRVVQEQRSLRVEKSNPKNLNSRTTLSKKPPTISLDLPICLTPYQTIVNKYPISSSYRNRLWRMRGDPKDDHDIMR